MRVANEVAAFLGAEAAGDDHLAVFVQRLADRVERLRDGGVDEAARVDDDQVRAVVRRRDRIAFGAQLRQDLLGIDERLRAAERHEADARWRGGRTFARGCHGHRCELDAGDAVLMRRSSAALRAADAAARRRAQRFLSSSGAVVRGAPNAGNGNAENMPRVWSCIRCCMSMNSFALCSR